MNNKLSLEQLSYIKTHNELGKKSPAIASELNISVWTVRKYVRLLKKG